MYKMFVEAEKYLLHFYFLFFALQKIALIFIDLRAIIAQNP